VLFTTRSNASPITSAMDRVVEIALGTIIGIIVSILVLPSRAQRICFEHSAEMLKRLAQVLVLHLQPPDPAMPDEIKRLNERVRAELAKVEAAAEEARREHLIRVAEGPVLEFGQLTAKVSHLLDLQPCRPLPGLLLPGFQRIGLPG
jgi:uncharacterized membrane protein YccC